MPDGALFFAGGIGAAHIVDEYNNTKAIRASTRDFEKLPTSTSGGQSAKPQAGAGFEVTPPKTEQFLVSNQSTPNNTFSFIVGSGRVVVLAALNQQKSRGEKQRNGREKRLRFAAASAALIFSHTPLTFGGMVVCFKSCANP